MLHSERTSPASPPGALAETGVIDGSMGRSSTGDAVTPAEDNGDLVVVAVAAVTAVESLAGRAVQPARLASTEIPATKIRWLVISAPSRRSVIP